MHLTGNWTKITNSECSDKYPLNLSFEHNGIYRAEASPSSRQHPVWDLGSYEVNGNSVRMSTSNDAVIAYEVTVKGDKLIFRDGEGCTIEYRRD